MVGKNYKLFLGKNRISNSINVQAIYMIYCVFSKRKKKSEIVIL